MWDSGRWWKKFDVGVDMISQVPGGSRIVFLHEKFLDFFRMEGPQSTQKKKFTCHGRFVRDLESVLRYKIPE